MVRTVHLALLICIATISFGQVKIIPTAVDSIVFDSSRIEIYNSQNNIFIGKDAGKISPAKNSNIAIGILSQSTSSSGGGNVSVGHNSLQNVEGTRNIALGNFAGFNILAGSRNLFLGQSAGHHAQNVSNNTIIGDEAGFNISNGYSNTILGRAAGFSIDSGHSNVLLGGGSGNRIMDGYQNLYGGNDSGFFNEGNRNVMLGQGSGTFNYNSNNNVYLGMHAGRNIDSSDYNVIIGPFAGENFNTGDYNVFIGHNAGRNATGSHQLIIDNSDTNTPLIYGDFLQDKLTINGQLKLGVTNQYTLPSFIMEGGFLRANTDSTSTWITPSLDDLSDGMNNNDNIFLGYPRSHLQGKDNIGIGKNSLSSLAENDLNNSENIGIGTNSISNLLEGSSNVAVGNWSMIGLDVGDSNSGYGDYAIGYLDNGDYNTGIGSGTGLLQRGGTGNTYLGYRAGSANYNHSKNYNVHIGYQAGHNDTTDYKLHIGSGWPSKTLIWGDFQNDSVRINGTLQIKNQYAFPASDGTNGQILSTNGLGQLNWSNGTINQKIEDQDQDTYITVESSADNDLVEMYTAGYNQLTLNGKNILTSSPGNSLFIGSEAGVNDNDNDNQNTFVGVAAGRNNETGQQNVFLGFESAYSNQNGNHNTSIGHMAGRENNSGNNNVFLGYHAGIENTESENVFLGANSGEALELGIGNVMLGFESGKSIVNGNRNLFLGYKAGLNTTGDHNLIIDNLFTDVPLVSGKFDERNVNFNWSPINPTNVATVNIDATLKLKPITNPPTCNGDAVGLIYFDLDLDKLRVCTSNGYVDLH